MSTLSQQHRCPWCGFESDQPLRTCPRCGALTDVRLATTVSGWTELPAIADMARLQLGKSVCQIEGRTVPVADFNLAEGDGIYFAHHLLLWKDDRVQLTRMKIAGAWKRIFAGLPIVLAQARGPGRIAFSKDLPGEIVALPMQPGRAVDVRAGVFMVATHPIAYDWFSTGLWFKTREDNNYEMHYPLGRFLERFQTTTEPGLLLLHGGGNVFERTLAPGESILIKPNALLFKDPEVRMHLHFEYPQTGWKTWRSWNFRYLWLRLIGPGRVGVQSHPPTHEENGRQLASFAPNTTSRQW